MHTPALGPVIATVIYQPQRFHPECEDCSNFSSSWKAAMLPKPGGTLRIYPEMDLHAPCGRRGFRMVDIPDAGICDNHIIVGD